MPKIKSRTILQTSLSIDNSISFGRIEARIAAKAKLLGNESPSWTHASIGKNQSFVLGELSSSCHETQVLNYRSAGTEALEEAPTPASGALFYGKKTSYQTIVVKKSASFFDTIPRPGLVDVSGRGFFVPKNFVAGSGSNINYVTGSAGMTATGSIFSPAAIFIDVPVSGRLVDIKVWLEVAQVSQSLPPGGGRVWPLANFGASLRAPNLSWGHAHPIMNDPALRRLYTSNTDEFANSVLGEGLAVTDAAQAGNLNNFYHDTFILWEPVQGFVNSIFYGIDSEVDADAVGSSVTGFFTSKYPMWQRDFSIRTVFSDGASTPNPRHLDGHVSQNYRGSPNAYHGINSPWGMSVPWTSDATVTGHSAYHAAGSPPNGWLSGPGGVANVNEWPTTGSNYGTNEIRPLYSLLDAIYQKKIIGTELPIKEITGSGDKGVLEPSAWRGFRPGLRGTQISGSWTLFLTAGPAGKFNGHPAIVETYFRQIRLEITYEPDAQSPTQVRRDIKKAVPRREGSVRTSVISGSDAFFFNDITGLPSSGCWNFYVSENWVDRTNDGEIGRTFGVQLNSGSFNSTQSALIYRITGTLAAQVGETPSWLLNNRFGMPQIPQMSASLVPPDQTVTSIAPTQSFTLQQKTLDGPRRLADVADTVNPRKTVIELAADFVSSSYT